jgi:glucokinase
MTKNARHTIGIDLGGTNVKGILVSPSGEVEHKDLCPTNPERGPDGVAERIGELTDKLLSSGDLGRQDISGVGIGVPGVTTADGIVVLAPNLKWHHVPFKSILSDQLGVRVEIDNDASVAALGEARLGVGKGCESLVLLTLGTGIGGGIVLNGEIHHGSSFSAGEIGHVCLEPDGPVCGCGKPGCLEALTAGPAMIRYVKEGVGQGRSTSLEDAEELTPELICNAASDGDDLAKETVARVTRYLGIAIANVINLVSPNIVAIGGGISAAGNLLLDPIVESAREYTLEGMFEHTRIVLATLGNDAGAIGASQLLR